MAFAQMFYRTPVPRHSEDASTRSLHVTGRIGRFTGLVLLSAANEDQPATVVGEGELRNLLAVIFGIVRQLARSELRSLSNPHVPSSLGIEDPGNTLP